MASSKRLLPLLANREEKKEEKEATLEEKEVTTWGKEGKKKKGEGVFGNTNVSKKEKKKETHLFPNTFDSRRAYHATTARAQRNDAKEREREREREREERESCCCCCGYNGTKNQKTTTTLKHTKQSLSREETTRVVTFAPAGPECKKEMRREHKRRSSSPPAMTTTVRAAMPKRHAAATDDDSNENDNE